MRTLLRASLLEERHAGPDDPLSRAVEPGDLAALAELMLSAYRGSVDDEGEGPAEARAEAQRLLDGDYGVFDFECSEVVERDGRIVSATLVTRQAKVPLLAFSMTAAGWKRHGLARAGLLRAMARLRAAGADELRLVVTEGNAPAEALYASLGFVRA